MKQLPSIARILVFVSSIICAVSGCAAPVSSSVPSADSSSMSDNGQSFKQIGNVAPAGLQAIGSSDSRLRYEGRLDFSDPSAPIIIWQGSRISIDFEGEVLVLRMERLGRGNSYFNVSVDGSTSILSVHGDAEQLYQYLKPLKPGRHSLTLFKRSEAAVGEVRFKGLEIAAGAKAWASNPRSYKLAMEFFGDSITAGACNEDGSTDQWENFLTHNNALSYAAVTASAFSADYRNTAVSGMGVCMGYVPVLAGEMWNKLYPTASSAPADLKAWTPDVVFVNLGENDDSFANSHSKPFPPAFTEGFVSLVKNIRGAYPAAHIVLLRGGMYGGAKSEALRTSWEAGVAKLESSDPAITHFVFTHWSSTHPRVADAKAMADELIAWLKQQDFMKSKL